MKNIIQLHHDRDESRHFCASDGTVLHPNALPCRPNYTERQTATSQIWTKAPTAVSSHFIILDDNSTAKIRLSEKNTKGNFIFLSPVPLK